MLNNVEDCILIKKFLTQLSIDDRLMVSIKDRQKGVVIENDRL